MTLGTGIVVSVAILCVTFIVLCAMGMSMSKKKQSTAEQITKEILKNRNKG